MKIARNDTTVRRVQNKTGTCGDLPRASSRYRGGDRRFRRRGVHIFQCHGSGFSMQATNNISRANIRRSQCDPATGESGVRLDKHASLSLE